MMLQQLRQQFPKYIHKQKKKTVPDVGSMRYLVEKDLNQSQCIRLGIELENILKDLILSHGDGSWILLKEILVEQKQCDHLFFNQKKNRIIYAEIKSNLNLDTEKSLATIHKCQLIERKLAEKYSSCHVDMFLVGLRYYKTQMIHPKISYKYKHISGNVCGVNEYLEMFGFDGFQDETEYKQFVNDFVDILF